MEIPRTINELYNRYKKNFGLQLWIIWDIAKVLNMDFSSHYFSDVEFFALIIY
jgi:hypothetical protein